MTLQDAGETDAYPRFSGAEMRRRRLALHHAMERHDVAHAVLYGAERSGSAVPWLTGWPVTREAAALVTPGEPDVLYVQHYNHVPLAERLARDADVRWGGASTMAAVSEELDRRGGGRPRVGLIGAVPYRAYATLAGYAEPVDLGAEYVNLRLVKSAEELEWLREGARLSDLGIAALDSGVRAGMREYELVDLVERGYMPQGGSTHIHYFGVTAMDDPQQCVPAQFPSTRRVTAGDALTVELSASYWGYPGQVLRTWTVEADPTPLYQRLHDVAESALDAMLDVLRDGAEARELLAAAALIDEAGFTTCDDLVHGFGGGYLPPVLARRGSPSPPAPDLRLRAGMTLVLQPNVITPDGRAGVQTGELVAIRQDGYERLHSAPPGLRRLGGRGAPPG